MSDEIIRIAVDDSDPGFNFRFLGSGVCFGYRWKRFGIIANLKFYGPDHTGGNFGVNVTPQAHKYVDGVTHLGLIAGGSLAVTGLMANISLLFGARDEQLLAQIVRQKAEQAERVKQFAIARLSGAASPPTLASAAPEPSGTGSRGGF